MSKEEQMELLQALMEICAELGWSVALPPGEENDVVSGMIVGSEEFISDIMINMGVDFDVFEHNEVTGEIEENKGPLTSGKDKLH